MKLATDKVLNSRIPAYGLAFAILLGVAGNTAAHAAEYQEDYTPTEISHTHADGHTHGDQEQQQRWGD